jgi:Anthrone oxygenase
MLTTALIAVGVLGSGVQAGALLMVLYGVCPTFRTLEVPEWIRLHVSLDRSVERYMPALNVLTGATTLWLLFLAQSPEARLLRILALACNIALALMSELVNVRINKAVAARVAVSPAGEPIGLDDHEHARLVGVRERWIRWHQWRTLDIVAGFGLYVAAVLVSAA